MRFVDRATATIEGIEVASLNGLAFFSKKYSKGRRAVNILTRNGISKNRFLIHTSKGHRVRYFPIKDKLVLVYKADPKKEDSHEKTK